MQCSQCKFENMPGQTACFRCGSVLDGKAVAVDVHPPRAPAWKKPFRQAERWARRRRTVRKAEALAKRASARTAALAGDATEALGFGRPKPLPPWVEIRRALWQMLVALALSIVPGGAHLVRHRFKAVYLYVISWFASLALGIFLYGTSFGLALISTAIVLHAWIALDAVGVFGTSKRDSTALSRIGRGLVGLAVLVILTYALYVGVRNAAVPGITMGESGIAVPAHRVALRDSILCRRLRQEPAPLRRGDLVLVRSGAVGQGEYHDYGFARIYGRRNSGETVGQLIGLPGDTVKLTGEGFVVNGRAIDPEKFPVPAWLRGRELTITLGERRYFVTMEYRSSAHGHVAPADERMLVRACEFDRGHVLARGFMRWLPLGKRGFLKELE